MANKIIYLQSNEKASEEFREYFNDSELELIVTKNGEEALAVLSKESNVLLLLIDINIPDMRLRELVERSKRIAPQLALNVIIDVADPLLIVKLSNRYSISKIYTSNQSLEEIADDLNDSVEMAIIEQDTNIKESEIESDIQEVESAIINLTDMLRKQKNSYTKLSGVFKCISEAFFDEFKFSPDFDRRYTFSKDVFEAILKMQTTGSFDIDKFEDVIKADLNEIHLKHPKIEIVDVVSCLFGGVSKTSAENIRFSIWLIARYYSEFYDEFTYEIISHFLTTTKAEFRCNIVLSSKYSNEDIESRKEERSAYRAFVFTLLEKLSDEVSREEENGKITIVYTIPVENV